MRRACRYLKLSRSAGQYRPKEALKQVQATVKRIVWLSRKYPRYGYRRIRALLDSEGWKVSRKFVQRIRKFEGLGVKGKRPKQRRQGHSTAAPTRATQLNEVWCWDFVHDRTDDGASLKMLTLIDEYSRQCLAIKVDRKLRSQDVLNALAEVMARRGVPKYIRSDNGSEFIAKELQEWFKELQIEVLKRYFAKFVYRDGLTFRNWIIPRSLTKICEKDLFQLRNVGRRITSDLIRVITDKGVPVSTKPLGGHYSGQRKRKKKKKKTD